MHLKGISPFKMHKIIFFPKNLKQIIGSTNKFRYGRVTITKLIFYLAKSNETDETGYNLTAINKDYLNQTWITFYFLSTLVHMWERYLALYKFYKYNYE